jgi:hypothetical protein
MLNASKLFSCLMIVGSFLLFGTPRVAAQEQPAKDTKTEIFADFESGTYEGWTEEGNAFGSAPVSDTTFQTKITGFGGKRFVCSFDPKLGNNATGKLISKEFTIDKPFIDFKIGGGRYPKEACLNLIVDGKIVRTETGTDSPDLRHAYWDVSSLIGKQARFEIVDSTASPNRGYVMVDTVRFVERPPLRPQRILEQMGIKPYFTEHSTFFRDAEERRNGRYIAFGVPESTVDQIINEIWRQFMSNVIPYQAGKDAAYWGGRIQETVDRIIAKFTAEPSKLLKQWMYAEGVCAWVTVNVHYEIAKDDPYKDGNWTLNAPVNVLARAKPWAQCCGYGMLVRDLARVAGKDVGLECYYVGGWFIGQAGIPAQKESNHGWSIFKFENDLYVPADATYSANLLADGGIKRTAKSGAFWFCLPRKREEWELFLAMYWGNIYPDGKNILNIDFSKVRLGTTDVLTNLTLEEWRVADTSNLKNLLFYRRNMDVNGAKFRD